MFSYKQALQLPSVSHTFAGHLGTCHCEDVLPAPGTGAWTRVEKLVPAWVLSLGRPAWKPPWGWGRGEGHSTLSTLLCEGPTEETEAGNPAFSFSGGNWLAQCHAAAGVRHGRWLPLCRRWEAGSHPDPQRWPLPPGGQHVQKKQRVCECSPPRGPRWEGT